MNAFREQAATLAHELTHFAFSQQTSSHQEESLPKWPGVGDVGPVFHQLLQDLVLLEPEEWNQKTKMKEDLGMDSLDLVELAMNCEREFGITLSDSELQPLGSIGDWKALLEGKVQLRK